ncbi:MAG: hypothetical protein K2K21_16580, partial [Lachnospiraceae bacterium]|nr:hypothetical protein [Lachnospiraceae bacterium]
MDKYHERVLEINEMTRNRVNTVFENVAEINTRYAGRMKDCQEKIKEQIAMVNTMTEFMQSMTDGNPNLALITKGSVNESIRTEEEVDLTGTSSDDAKNEPSIYFLNDYFDSGEEFSEDEIKRILDGALSSGDINQYEYDNLIILLPQLHNIKQILTDEII